MSRVSLGHTGRPLELPPYFAVAFALIGPSYGGVRKALIFWVIISAAGACNWRVQVESEI